MGKTAIAWMIALAQLAGGSEAIACDSPEDFFGAYRPQTPQIFVADDAFGRTEYDPTRGLHWETQLHRVVGRLGNTHWLVWTSRKHILERARNQMDLQGPAASFPKPAEVLVDASKLTIREKALMLYRHAKYSIADPSIKQFIKDKAVSIVSHPAFTPERIRRFVNETAPRLLHDAKQTHSRPKSLDKQIQEEIKNPTDRMRKSFQALSSDHKWMLLSLLEGEHYCRIEALFARLRRQCPNAAPHAQRLLEELSEAFVRQKGDATWRYVEWIHPSYRDLVVEQLRDGGSLKKEFLQGMTIPGIKLALSDTGGEIGTLSFPLLSSSNDWALLEERCIQIAREADEDESAHLLTTLTAALDQAKGNTKETLARLLSATCTIVRNKWDMAGAALNASQITAFGHATIHIFPMQPMPSLANSWQAAFARLENQLRDESVEFFQYPAAFDDLLAMVSAIEQLEPRMLRQVGFPEAQLSLWESVLERVDYELDADRSYDSPEGYDGEADSAFGLAESLKRLLQFIPRLSENDGVPRIVAS